MRASDLSLPRGMSIRPPHYSDHVEWVSNTAKVYFVNSLISRACLDEVMKYILAMFETYFTLWVTVVLLMRS